MLLRSGFVLAASALLALLAARPGAGDERPSTEAVDIPAVLAHLRTATACEAWRNAGSVRVTGYYENLRGRFSNVVEPAGGRFMESVRTPLIVSGDGFDGRTWWSRDMSNATHPLDAFRERAIAQTESWFATRGWCAPGDPTAYRAATLRTDGARSLVVLEVEPRNGAVAHFWIDVQTGFPDRLEEQHNEYRWIEHLDDWRSIGKNVVAFHERDEDPEDESNDDYFATAVTFGPALPASAFAMPPLPDDVTMLHGSNATTVPYTYEGDKITLPVWLDGRGPFPFVLDTGGHFILTRATVASLGMHLAPDQDEVPVANVRIGDAVIARDVAEIHRYDRNRLDRGTLPPRAGWLGLTLFERFAVTIDPGHRTVTLRPFAAKPAAAHGASLPITFDDDAPYVPCTIAAIGGPCMIDTGNASPTIVEPRWAKRTGLGARLRGGLNVGASRYARADVRFGPFDERDELLVVPPPETSGSEASTAELAILGENLIDRYVTTVDFQRELWTLAPVAHPYRKPFNRSGLLLIRNPDGAVVVRTVIPGSPAIGAGIAAGDTIVAVDGVAVATMARYDVDLRLLAPPGTLVRLRVGSHGRERDVGMRLRELLP